jgi:excinuclease UvrABC nuclease subunit
MSGELVRYANKARALDALAAVRTHSFWFPELPGVYVFDRFDETLYVGESRNLRARLKTGHERGYLRRTVAVRCRIVVCSNHKAVEKWLIAELKPSLNGVSEERRRRIMRAPVKTVQQIDREFGAAWDHLFGPQIPKAAA